MVLGSVELARDWLQFTEFCCNLAGIFFRRRVNLFVVVSFGFFSFLTEMSTLEPEAVSVTSSLKLSILLQEIKAFNVLKPFCQELFFFRVN